MKKHSRLPYMHWQAFVNKLFFVFICMCTVNIHRKIHRKQQYIGPSLHTFKKAPTKEAKCDTQLKHF